MPEHEKWTLIVLVVVAVGFCGWGMTESGQATMRGWSGQAVVRPRIVVEDVRAPAPTLKAGKKNSEGHIMSWIVSGAGDNTYNGTYVEDGEHNSHPAYVLDKGGANERWLFWYDQSWKLNTTKVGNIGAYTNDNTELPGNWSVTPPPNSGTEPAPTVSGGAGLYPLTWASPAASEEPGDVHPLVHVEIEDIQDALVGDTIQIIRVDTSAVVGSVELVGTDEAVQVHCDLSEDLHTRTYKAQHVQDGDVIGESEEVILSPDGYGLSITLPPDTAIVESEFTARVSGLWGTYDDEVLRLYLHEPEEGLTWVEVGELALDGTEEETDELVVACDAGEVSTGNLVRLYARHEHLDPAVTQGEGYSRVIVEGPSLTIGDSPEAAARWADADLHKWSLHGPDIGAGWDVTRRQVLTGSLQCRVGNLRDGAQYTLRTRLGEYVWSQATVLGRGTGVNWLTAVPGGLPWGKTSIWRSRCVAAAGGYEGPVELVVELLDDTDKVVASASAHYTQVEPAIDFVGVEPGNAPAPVGDNWEALVDLINCWQLAPGTTYGEVTMPVAVCLYARDGGDPEEYLCLHGQLGADSAWLTTGRTTLRLDMRRRYEYRGSARWFPQAVTPDWPEGEFVATVAIERGPGVGLLGTEAEIMAQDSMNMEHVESYALHWLSPPEDAVLRAGGNEGLVEIDSGTPSGFLRVLQEIDGEWSPAAEQAPAGPAINQPFALSEGWFGRNVAPVGFNAPNPSQGFDLTGLRVEWWREVDGSWAMVDSDERRVTNGYITLPPEPPPPPPGPERRPWVEVDWPASGATLAGAFAMRVLYGEFQGTADGRLTITAVHDDGWSSVLYDGAVVIRHYADGSGADSYTLNLSFPSGAPLGGYVITARLQNEPLGESASDTVGVEVEATEERYFRWVLPPEGSTIRTQTFDAMVVAAGYQGNYIIQLGQYNAQYPRGVTLSGYTGEEGNPYFVTLNGQHVEFNYTGLFIWSQFVSGPVRLEATLMTREGVIVAQDSIMVEWVNTGDQYGMRIIEPVAGAGLPQGTPIAVRLAYSGLQGGITMQYVISLTGMGGTLAQTITIDPSGRGEIATTFPHTGEPGSKTLEAVLYSQSPAQILRDSVSVVITAAGSALTITEPPPGGEIEAGALTVQGIVSGPAARVTGEVGIEALLRSGDQQWVVGTDTDTWAGSATTRAVSVVCTVPEIDPGEYELVLRVATGALYGTLEASHTVTLVESDPETWEPEVRIIAPLGGDTVGGRRTPVVVGYSGFSAGAATLTLSVDSVVISETAVTLLATGGQVTVEIVWPSPLSAGEKVITADITQGAAADDDTVTVTWAANPGASPWLRIAAPTSGQTISRQTELLLAWGELTPDPNAVLTITISGRQIPPGLILPVETAGSTRLPITIPEIIQPGSHRIVAVLTTAGETVTDNVTIIVAEEDAQPWVTIVYPAAGDTIAREEIACTGYYGPFAPTSEGRLKVELGTGEELYEAALAVDSSGRWTAGLSLPEEYQGSMIELVVTATDIYGVAVARQFNYYEQPEELIGPEVTIIEPEAGAVSGQVVVLATITDNRGVSAAICTVDGVQVQGTLRRPNAGGNWRWVWDSRRWANGSHVITVTAWDTDGNTGSDTVTVALVNSQAEQTRLWFTKQLGTDSANLPINAESRHWGGILQRSIEVVDVGEVPEEIEYQYNLQVAYHTPGDTVDWNDFRLIEPVGRAHDLVPNGRTIRWAMRATPRRTLSQWPIEAADCVRLAVSEDGEYVYGLTQSPHGVWRLRLQNGYLHDYWPLAAVPTSPVDMAVVDGKVLVAAGPRMQVLDVDDGDLQLQLTIADDVEAITALAVADGQAIVAANVVGGGSRIYSVSYPSTRLVAEHTETITALAVINRVVYVGDHLGDIYTLASGLQQQVETGTDGIVRLIGVGSDVYAGTDDYYGELWSYAAGGWSLDNAFGFGAVAGLAEFAGQLWAGGTGTGGGYLWRADVDGWVQTLGLEGVVGVNDLLAVDYEQSQALFAACTTEGGAAIVRVEMAPASALVCGPERPNVRFKVVQSSE